MDIFSTAGFILVINYVRMEVTLVGSSWVVVAGGQTGVDFIPICVTGNSYTWLSLTHTGAPSRMHSCRKRFQPHHTHPVHT